MMHGVPIRHSERGIMWTFIDEQNPAAQLHSIWRLLEAYEPNPNPKPIGFHSPKNLGVKSMELWKLDFTHFKSI